jgi:hypothetical protein
MRPAYPFSGFCFKHIYVGKDIVSIITLPVEHCQYRVKVMTRIHCFQSGWQQESEPEHYRSLYYVDMGEWSVAGNNSQQNGQLYDPVPEGISPSLFN